MKREFLESLGLEKEAVDKIMAENGADLEREKAKATQAKADLAEAQQKLSDREKDLEELKKSAGDAEAVKKQLEELQTKYNTETEEHKAAMAKRDYSDAVNAAVADLKFSSKGARSAFVADLIAKNLPLKDGAIDGFDAYLKSAKEADPDAFDTGKPRFGTRPVGGASGQPKSTGETMAETLGKMSAQQNKAANDIISMYTKGDA